MTHRPVLLLAGLLFFVQTVLPPRAFAQRHPGCTISGTVSDAATGKRIIHAAITSRTAGQGATADTAGFFTLTLAPGTHVLMVQSLGYEPATDTVRLTGNAVMHFRLVPAPVGLPEIRVNAADQELAEERSRAPLGAVKIPVRMLASVPAIGGEADLMKLVQLLPGVLPGVEGANGLFVRGGDADQNLILLDGATVYNPAHLLGFFSVFNPETLGSITLLKGGFPARYGGRLASVLDVKMPDAHPPRLGAEGGVGLLSSRATLRGPLFRNKATFLVGFRRTYLDGVARAVNRRVPYYFYDLNGKVTFALSARDKLSYSTYLGNDVLDLSMTRRDTAGSQASLINFGFRTGNQTHTLHWRHQYNEQLFSEVSLLHTRFRYQVQGLFSGDTLLAQSGIADLGIKADYTYHRNAGNQAGFGVSATLHQFRPTLVSTSGVVSDFVTSGRGEALSTAETALYAWQERQLNGSFGLNYGLRLSMAGVKNKSYAVLEPRLSLWYRLEGEQSLKFGYSRMSQYLHLISSSFVALPTDLWYPVTDRLGPQVADQLSLGYQKGFEKSGVSFTAEAYYKAMQNVIEYRPGARLLLNPDFADELLTGRGRAYGLEMMVQRKAGPWSGWVSYTLSWSQRQFDAFNGGNPYFTRYDRRHNVAVVGSFDVSRRVTLSATWVFLSGARFTPPVALYAVPSPGLTGVEVLPVYAPRNSVQLPPSHRLDLNLIIKRKPARKWRGEWHIGAYNAYNRAQPYTIDVVADAHGNYRYQARGLFGFIPSVAYNFKF